MTEILIEREAELDALVAIGHPVVVLFTAPAWCMPCRRLEPHWIKAQQDPDLKHIHFAKVDMGLDPIATGEHWATAKFHILGVPHIRFFVEGQESIDIQSRAIVPLKKELLNFER